MRSDLEQIDRELKAFEARPPLDSWCDDEVTAVNVINNSKLPTPVRSAALILGMLPTSARIIGVVCLCALAAYALFLGVR